jgi:hypothetical protein
MNTKEIMSNVNIRNIYTLENYTTHNDGTFSIKVKKDELIEITKIGYETQRIRIYNEQNPSYYKLYLKPATKELPNIVIKGRYADFAKDSARYSRYYERIIQSERKENIPMENLAMAMLSKSSREKWAFQAMYEKWEHQRYIDSRFNEKLILKLTAIPKTKVRDFIQNYSPSYELVRRLSEYEFLQYIKDAADEYLYNQ